MLLTAHYLILTKVIPKSIHTYSAILH